MEGIINFLMNNLQALAIVAGFVGALLTIRRQTRVFQTYVALEFFRRYADISKAMPDRLRRARLGDDASSVSEEEWRQIARSAIEYWNLCSEEHALWRQGRIPSDIWKLWGMGIRHNFQSEIWRVAWTKVSGEYAGNQRFTRFIEKHLKEAEQAVRRKRVSVAV